MHILFSYQGYDTDSHSLTVPADTLAGVKSLALRLGVSTCSVLLSAFQVLVMIFPLSTGDVHSAADGAQSLLIAFRHYSFATPTKRRCC